MSKLSQSIFLLVLCAFGWKEVILNKRLGIAIVLLGTSGMAVALLYLCNVSELVIRYAIGCLSLIVMAYGGYFMWWLKLDSVRKHTHAEEYSNEANN